MSGADAGAPLNSPPEPPYRPPSAAEDELADARDRTRVQAVLTGDDGAARRAYEELYHAHRERIFAVTLRVLRNREDALEATQETFLKALRALASFRLDGCFRAWLYRIAMNAAIDRYRRRKRRRSHSYEDELDSPVDAGSSARFTAPTVSTERDEVRQRIEAALESLPEMHRTVFLLFSQEGLQYGEIAELVGIPIGTVMSRLYHARRKLAAQLPEEWDPGGRRRREKPAPARTDRKTSEKQSGEEAP